MVPPQLLQQKINDNARENSGFKMDIIEVVCSSLCAKCERQGVTIYGHAARQSVRVKNKSGKESGYIVDPEY